MSTQPKPERPEDRDVRATAIAKVERNLREAGWRPESIVTVGHMVHQGLTQNV